MLSIIIPVYNEEKSLPSLFSALKKTLEGLPDAEVILVDDGSTDRSFDEMEALAGEDGRFRIIRFAVNAGQTAAIQAGIDFSSGDILVFMDSDMQNDPADIPKLLEKLGEGYDVVSGWRRDRKDNPIKRNLPSRVANGLISKVSGVRLHDYGCTLKAYRKEMLDNVCLYGEMHRFIPILARQAGFRRIGEKVVEHRARKYGCSKFGLERMIKGYLDLISVLFMSRFGRSPMYLFGSLGTLMFLLGGGTTFWIIGAKLWKQAHGLPLRPVAEQPLFYLAMLAVVLGVQLFLAGFLGEMINRTSTDRNRYLIDKTL